MGEPYLYVFIKNIITSFIKPLLISITGGLIVKIVWGKNKHKIETYKRKILRESKETKARPKQLKSLLIKGLVFILKHPIYVSIALLFLIAAITFFVSTPNVLGKNPSTAKRIVTGSKLMFETDRLEYSNEPEETVISQNPKPGKIIIINRLLKVIVSKGKPEIPDLVGVKEKEAKTIVEKLKLWLYIEKREYSNILKDTIISQSPKAKNGKKISVGKDITVIVSKGKPKLPDLIGKSKAEAETLLKERKLMPVIQEGISDKPKGTVIKQSIEPDTIVNIDTQVVIVISRPQPLEITNLFDQALVYWWPTVTVKYDSIRNNEYAWIIIHPHGTNAWHPQLSELDIVKDSSGTTSKAIYVGEEGNVDIGRQFDIAVVLTDATAHQVFKDYMSNAIANQEYPGISDLPTNVTIIHKITVTRQ